MGAGYAMWFLQGFRKGPPADCAFFHRPFGGLNAWIHVSGSIFASRFRGKRKDRMEES